MTHYCPNCKSEQHYTKHIEEIIINLDGNTMRYKTLVPYCLSCKSKLSIPEFDKINNILETVEI